MRPTKYTSIALAGTAALALLAAHGAPAAEPGEVVIVLPEQPDIVDPCESSRSNIGRVVKQNIVETLTEINPTDGSITPRLATSWEQVDDNTWRFKLREGVTFHDGAPLNAEAVKAGIDRTMDESIDCEIRIKFFGGIKLEVTPVDELTVDIKSSEPSPIMPTMMGTVTLASPNTPVGERTREPIGTGPYAFESWEVGQNIVLKRFDGYWGDKPEVETATYVWRTESAVQAAMVETGEADIAPAIAVQDATNPETDFAYLNSETSHLRIDVNQPPLDDIRVRKALNLAFDREAVKGSIMSADVIPATQLVVPSISGYNPDLKVWAYDPEQARQLIEEARADGVPVDNEITLIGRVNIYPNATEMMEAMMAMYQELGLNVKLQMLEVAEWVDILTKPFAEDREPTLLQGQHDNNNGDAVFTVYNKYHSDGGQSMLADPELDKVIVAAGAAVGEERQKLFQEAFRLINDVIIGDVPMFHMVGYTRVGPRISFKPDISTNSELHIAKISFK